MPENPPSTPDAVVTPVWCEDVDVLFIGGPCDRRMAKLGSAPIAPGHVFDLSSEHGKPAKYQFRDGPCIQAIMKLKRGHANLATVADFVGWGES